MKVFFDASVSTNKKVYALFKKTMKELGVEITYDWVKRGDVWKSLETNDVTRVKIYSKTIESIMNSNICIFDATIPSMRIGHELTLSMEKLKPTLVLMNQNLNNTQNLFLRGLNSKFLTFSNYKNERDFVNKIKEFIKKNKEVKKVRLDVKINKELNDFLDQLSVNNGTSKVDEIKKILLETNL